MVTIAEVPKGYKKTEAGIIPEDWEVKPLGELFSFSGGFTASREQLSDEGFCYLHYGDIHKSNKTYIDVKGEYLEIPKLDISLNKVPAKSLLHDGDVVFVDASEDDEGVSRHIVVRNSKGTIYISGLHTIVSKSKDDSLDNEYKQYCFQTRDVKKQFKYYAVGTKVSGISKTNIAKIQLPCPSKPEQKSIATVLSDIDRLIANLDELLAKKRNVKQGAMQELLTGKKRLPGFSGEWKTKKLGEIGKFRGGSGFPIKYQGNVDGDYPFFKVSDMNNPGNQIFMVNSNNWINENARKQIGAKIFPKHTIVFAKIGAAIFLERKKILDRESCADNNMMGFVYDEDNVNHRFMHYLFLTIQLGKLVSATALPSLNGKEIAELQLDVPEFEEQSAIAQILSDMDAEIDELEGKLNKYRMIKQGMMQELLTGKTRLI